MRYVGMVLAVALVAFVVVAPASAQSKWVVGTVVSTGPDTVTVKAGDTDMVFKVTPDTQLIARGAGTAMQAAQKAGAKGVDFTKFVKVGEAVEVHYKGEGAAMTATEIRTGVRVPAKAAPQTQVRGASIMGNVTELTGDSLTLKAEGKDWKFMTTPKTQVIGHGMGTKAAELKASGQGPSVKDLLVVNDIVTVKYVPKGDMMQAVEITMITPSLTRK